MSEPDERQMAELIERLRDERAKHHDHDTSWLDHKDIADLFTRIENLEATIGLQKKVIAGKDALLMKFETPIKAAIEAARG